jgi:hypothetical protein
MATPRRVVNPGRFRYERRMGRAGRDFESGMASAPSVRAAETLLWLAGAGAVGFAVSFLGAAVFELGRPSFVAWHLTVSGVFLAACARRFHATWTALVRRWPAGLLAGGAAAGFSIAYVLRQPASEGPGMPELLGAMAWLGAAYGAVDALLLTVAPAALVLTAAGRLRARRRIAGEIAASAAALAASAAVTFAYHAGFPEFQGAAMLQPLIGNGVITLAYLVSRSPLAALIAHAALHAAAVVHAYSTSAPLPPHFG